MRYLFFDSESIHIEHKYSYTFGYVLTDENFNVLIQEDIVFNPDLKREEYDWRVVRTMMEPSYSLKEVNKKEPFTKFYTKIKRLICDPGTLCIGFEMGADVNYLLGNCFRYNLDSINFNYIDIRDVIKNLTQEKSKGLAKEYLKWCHKIPELSHTSDIDAMMTCQVLRQVLNKYEITLSEFLSKHNELIYEAKDYCYMYEGCVRDVRIPRVSSHERINGIRFKKLKDEKVDCIENHSVNKLLFLRYLDFVEIKRNTGHVLEGKRVSISLNFERYNYKNMVKIISLLAERGSIYVKKASQSDIMVTYDNIVDGDGNVRSCSKLNHVNEANSNGANISIMDFDSFLKMLDIDREGLDKMNEIDLEYLKDRKYSNK